MSKGLIAFIIVAAVGLGATLIIEMRKSADDAHKRSEELLQDFNTIDKSLKESDTSIDASGRRLIESLREAHK